MTSLVGTEEPHPFYNRCVHRSPSHEALARDAIGFLDGEDGLPIGLKGILQVHLAFADSGQKREFESKLNILRRTAADSAEHGRVLREFLALFQLDCENELEEFSENSEETRHVRFCEEVQQAGYPIGGSSNTLKPLGTSQLTDSLQATGRPSRPRTRQHPTFEEMLALHRVSRAQLEFALLKKLDSIVWHPKLGEEQVNSIRLNSLALENTISRKEAVMSLSMDETVAKLINMALVDKAGTARPRIEAKLWVPIRLAQYCEVRKQGLDHLRGYLKQFFGCPVAYEDLDYYSDAFDELILHKVGEFIEEERDPSQLVDRISPAYAKLLGSIKGLVRGVFEEILWEVSQQVEAGTLQPAMALESLRRGLYERICEANQSKMELSIDEYKRYFCEGEIRRVPRIEADLRGGRWTEGTRTVTQHYLSPKRLHRLGLALDQAIWNDPAASAAFGHYFRQLAKTKVTKGSARSLDLIP